MPTNFYFQSGLPMGNNSESLLHEDLIIECLKMYGFDVYYMPRQAVNRDFILGEDSLNKFDYAYPIEVYLENITGFAGNDLMSKFGVELKDTATFLMARRRWDELINRKGKGALATRPAEGDLLYFPTTKSFFEIKLVEATDPFFQVGKLYVYKLQCELYQFSSEEVDTGVAEIDELADDLNQNILSHEFLLETGDALLLEYDAAASIILEDFNETIDKAEINKKLDNEAPEVLDFTESNPFGEVYVR